MVFENNLIFHRKNRILQSVHFFDNEEITKHIEYVGKRIKRGLFRTQNGSVINADVKL